MQSRIEDLFAVIIASRAFCFSGESWGSCLSSVSNCESGESLTAWGVEKELAAEGFEPTTKGL